ncbi:L-histidine N(alpha)-methyltransferase [Nostoc sp. FACHB-280]|uniref:L-histidine N(alpha)-methyltransferase n=1 Tax=Nostoc sp. FACHB-280 TaxID=2692839 RepID=UPI00168BE5D4|nr:L-histidine N(alpha)-methyltransferase [Nostoc sp. FACHB-280]MBD2496469.1 L-histidine N(alpha)-methyltransferase [Nostoc sp. FACHB-280]
MTISQAVNSKVPSLNNLEERLQIQRLIEATKVVTSTAGSDVVKGLTHNPKYLPPYYLYDDRGSDLFEQICDLPEYYVTRTETAILQQYADEIAQITGACELVELGSGSSTKTRILLDAYQKLGYLQCYLPIDVSAGMLENSARKLLQEYPSLQVYALAGTYEMALAQLPAKHSPSRMIGFIGSSLGNMTTQECDTFFSQITNALQVGEYFLLGVDLQKPKEILEPAYNDRQGVTAAFNINMLEHLNRRFEGNFDTTQFEHWAFYNETAHQIEMHLRSMRSQTVQLKSLNLTVNFAPGETILTEISRKFNLNTIKQQLQSRGLVPIQTWTDANQWFGLLLCQFQSN